MSDEPALDRPGTSEDRIRWGLGEAVTGYLVAFFLLNLVAALWFGATGEEEPSLGSLVSILVASWTGLVGAAVLTSRFKGIGTLRDDFGLRIAPGDVLPGLVVGVVSQLALVPLVYLPVKLLNPDLDLKEEARNIVGVARGPGLALLFLFLVVGAPVVEELFFRGLLQRALARRFGPRWAVAVSAVVFGLIHFQPLLFFGLAAFGVVLGLLAHRSGRLGPGIVAHAAFNAVTVVLLVMAR